MKAKKIINLVLVSFFAFALLGMPVQVSAQEPSFFISACRFEHWISVPTGDDLLLGVTVTLTIFDSKNELVYTDTAAIQQRGTGFKAAQFEFPNFELQPGFIVTATSTAPPIEKTLTISPLEVKTWDLAADTVSGIATPGKQVNITVRTTNGPVSGDVVADATTGEWTTDFFGFDPEQGWHTIDLVPGSFGVAFEEDDDGDNTWNDWLIPNPFISVRALYGDQVDAKAWPTGAVLTLTIDNPNTAVNPDYQAIQPAEGESAGQTETYAHFYLDNIFDIQPGFLINVTDGTWLRTYTVTNMHFTNWNKNTMDSNIVTGVSQPNALVEVWACFAGSCENSVHRSVTADAYGNWTADFNQTGGDPAIDLIYGTWVDSEEMDESGQKTMYGRWIPFEPPVADAGSDLYANEGIPIHLDASGSYSLFGDLVTLNWDLDGDDIYVDAFGATPSVAFPDNGTYIVGLKATDPFEWTSTDTVQVTVANVSPVVSLQPIFVYEGGNIAGNGFFIDPGADSWTGIINFGDGNNFDLNLLLNQSFTFSHQYSGAGDYLITVCVEDDDDGLGCSQIPVKVSNNHQPMAEAGGPYYVNEGSSILLNANKSDDLDKNIVNYEWDLNCDGKFDATAIKTTFAAIDNGTFNVCLCVTDAGNLSSVDTAEVVVYNVPPLITSFSTNSPVQAGTTLYAQVIFSDVGVKDTFTAEWNWGDGTSTTIVGMSDYTLIRSHVYTNPGTYNVTITIKDNAGGTVKDSKKVTVLRRK